MPTVCLVIVDGLRPDAIAKAKCPVLQGVIAKSAYTLKARAVMPSITLPCHMSTFYSVPAERHGVTTNTWQPMARPLPGIVEQAAQAGKRCAFFINWEQLRDCARPGNLHHMFYEHTCEELPDGDMIVAQQAAQELHKGELDLAFVYLGTLDTVGHRMGWMSQEYTEHIEYVDRALAIVLDALGPDDHLILHADHGGHDRSHGTEADDDMLIPWVLRGPGVVAGPLDCEVTLLDTAPTIAHLLGVQPHRDWEGRCVNEAFGESWPS